MFLFTKNCRILFNIKFCNDLFGLNNSRLNSCWWCNINWYWKLLRAGQEIIVVAKFFFVVTLLFLISYSFHILNYRTFFNFFGNDHVIFLLYHKRGGKTWMKKIYFSLRRKNFLSNFPLFLATEKEEENGGKIFLRKEKKFFLQVVFPLIMKWSNI